MEDTAEQQLKAKIKKALLDEKIRRAAKQQADAERPKTELIVQTAEEVPSEKIVKLFGGRLIQGSFQLLVGPGDAGKGMLSCDIIARLSTGAPFPGEGNLVRPPISVLACVTEDSAGRVRARLEASEANLKKIHFVKGPAMTRGGLVLPSQIAMDDDAGSLVDLARKVGAGALFLETMLEHLGDREGRQKWSTNNEAEVRRALAPIIAVCRAGNLVGWGVMHPRKSQDGGIEDSVSGSAAFRNVGRGVLHVYQDPKSEEKPPWRLLITSKANYLKDKPPTLKFRIESFEKNPDEGRVVWGIEGRTLEDKRTAEEVWREIRDVSTARRDYSVRDAEDLLKAILINGAVVPIASIQKSAEESGIPWRAIQKAKEKIGVESKKEGFPAKVVGWTLAKEEM